MQQKKLRQDNLFYAANLIGLAVLFYLLLAELLKTALNALCAINLPGSGLQNPAGLPVWLSMLLNCAATIINLGLPIAALFSWVKPLGLPPLRLTKPTARLTGIWLPLFLCFTSLGSAASNLVRLLLGFGGYTPPAALQLPTSGGALLLAFLAVCVLPAIFEEILFRGLIQRALSPYGAWFSIVVTSVLFALLHSDLSQLPAIFALSLFLGYVYAFTKNLSYSILLHFANNLSGFVLLWAKQQMDGANAFGISAILFSVYLGAGLLALLLLRHSGGPVRLPRYPTRKNRMGRTERLLSAPVFTFTLLLLIVIVVLEYIR